MLIRYVVVYYIIKTNWYYKKICIRSYIIIISCILTDAIIENKTKTFLQAFIKYTQNTLNGNVRLKATSKINTSCYILNI